MKKFLSLLLLCGAAFAAQAQTYMVVETTQGTYRIDVNDISQVYWQTVEKEKIEPFVGETDIYDDAQIGDKGHIDGQEVVVAMLGDNKIAIATCNYGANTPSASGKYLNFKTLRAANTDHLWGETWRLPALAEMSSLMYDTTCTVTSMNMVPGCMWYIGPKRTELFFPMAGEKSYGDLTGYGEVGYYWTSDAGGDGAWCMGIKDEEDPMDATFYINSYSTDLLSVRLVSDLKPRP